MSYQNVCDQCRVVITPRDFVVRVRESERGSPLTGKALDFCCWLCLQQYAVNHTRVRVSPEGEE